MKRVAILVPGGFGTGKNNHGIPVLEQIVKRLSKEFEISVFQLYQVNEDYQPDGFELLAFRKSNKLTQYLKFFVAFRREHRKKKFSAVHGFWAWPCGFCAVVFGKMFGMKSVVSVLGGDGSSVPEINYGYLHRFFYRKLIVWSLNHATEATALTRFLLDNLARVGLKRELKIVPWGVDSTLFSYKQKNLGNPIQFLHVGNFNAVKDQSTLLKAFAIVSRSFECRLTMIGEGSEESNLLKLIDDLGVKTKVTVLHHMHYSKLPEFYHASDVLVHTSLSEGQSEVVTEAMSCGVIVCGTKVGLLYDLPDGCVSVALKDHVSLAEKIISVIKDQSALDSIRRQANEWVSVHDLNWTVQEIGRLYH